jgi:very-short-patch-repair endonuclease
MREHEVRSRAHAKALRRELTSAETILWSKLRLGRQHGFRFRRQHPIGPYIADFACIRARVVVELDGATHSTDEERAYDSRRNSFMRELGWRVLRFPNHEIYENLHDVIDSIYAVVPPPRG